MSIAYQVTGEGPLDLMFRPAAAIPIDLLWEEPSFVRFAKRLGRFSRTVWCDDRGNGSSGGDVQDTFVDEIVDADITAVLDAAGCDRVVLVGSDTAGPNVIHYAVTHPERVSALVLIDTYACYLRDDDYPWGWPRSSLGRYTASALKIWGTGTTLEFLGPSKASDERFRAWWARCQRLGVGVDHLARGSATAAFGRDVRGLLATLAVPTLVLHREGNRHIRVGAGRYLAGNIPEAKYVELPGDDHIFFVGDTDALLDEVEEFLTGSHQAPEGEVATATILFTDIVASTEMSARLGHRKWRTVTDDHDAMVRASLQRHRGREIKTLGDGFLATFDGGGRAVRCATEIVRRAKVLGIEVRAGIHTGDVELRGDDVAGLPVAIAKRICDRAEPEEVLVSGTVRDLVVGSGITFTDRDEHELKGTPGVWRLFAVKG